jgi:hypothetical protein
VTNDEADEADDDDNEDDEDRGVVSCIARTRPDVDAQRKPDACHAHTCVTSSSLGRF